MPQGPAVATEQQSLEVNGTPRLFLLTTPAPSPAVTPRPLVLDFHGLAEGAQLQATTSQFGVLGQKDGFIVAFPQGTGNPSQWDTSATSHPNADLTYVTDMLNSIESRLCVDTSRVYADGFSDGAFMVSLLACTMASRFAAIAAVSGLLMPKPCLAARPVPILAFHGTADPILYFNGGIGTAVLNHALNGGPTPPTTTTVPANLNGSGYPANVRAWANRDGCNPHSTETMRAPHIIERTYRCPPGVGVVFYIVLDGGHAWPGSKFTQSIANITGFTTFEINATDTIWKFFGDFQLPRAMAKSARH
jgi:polyhydroxybutyrate depolymerase